MRAPGRRPAPRARQGGDVAPPRHLHQHRRARGQRLPGGLVRQRRQPGRPGGRVAGQLEVVAERLHPGGGRAQHRPVGRPARAPSRTRPAGPPRRSGRCPRRRRRSCPGRRAGRARRGRADRARARRSAGRRRRPRPRPGRGRGRARTWPPGCPARPGPPRARRRGTAGSASPGSRRRAARCRSARAAAGSPAAASRSRSLPSGTTTSAPAPSRQRRLAQLDQPRGPVLPGQRRPDRAGRAPLGQRGEQRRAGLVPPEPGRVRRRPGSASGVGVGRFSGAARRGGRASRRTSPIVPAYRSATPGPAGPPAG